MRVAILAEKEGQRVVIPAKLGNFGTIEFLGMVVPVKEVRKWLSFVWEADFKAIIGDEENVESKMQEVWA